MKIENMSLTDRTGDSSLRVVSSEQDLLTRSDGSALFNHGDTSVLVAVYGPTEVRISKAIIDKATIEVIYKPKVGLPGCSEKMQERLIRNTCETVIWATLHPRTAINVVIQEMQNSGSLLSCCINATCLALMDASVPMKYMVAAVSCMVDSDGCIILDPSIKQETTAVAHMTFAFDSKDYNIVTSTAKGTYTDQLYHQCLLSCKQASKEIHQFYRDSIKKKLEKAL